jgi:hypothetical protein
MTGYLVIFSGLKRHKDTNTLIIKKLNI